MEDILVSVVIAINKDDGFFDEALRSIINQSYKNLEVLVIANNCSDELWLDIIRYADIDKRIRPYRLKIGGLAFSLNYGLEMAKGELIARMDADDISKKDRIEKQVDFFKKNPEVTILGTQYEYIDMHGNLVKKGRTKLPCNDEDIKNFLKSRTPFAHPTVMFRKNDIIKLGGYKYGFYGEDYDLWIRIYLNKMRMHNLPEVLLYYRTHNNQLSANSGKYSIFLILYYYWIVSKEIGFLWGSILYMSFFQKIIRKTSKLRNNFWNSKK